MIFLPDLNYWIHKRCYETDINEFPFEIPSEILSSWIISNSVVNLLFNDSYKESDYNYLYKQAVFGRIQDIKLTRRISTLLGQGLVVYLLDNDEFSTLFANYDAQNIFEFTEEEINMLDLLLQFRQNNSVNISGIDFDSLQSSFSQLVYIYLNLMVNDTFEIYDTYEPISGDRFIEVIFEKYVVDSYFRKIGMGYQTYDSTSVQTIINLVPVTEFITITNTMISNEKLTLQNIPYDKDFLRLIINGYKKIKGIDYNIISSNVEWGDYSLKEELQEGDKVVITYGTEHLRS